MGAEEGKGKGEGDELFSEKDLEELAKACEDFEKCFAGKMKDDSDNSMVKQMFDEYDRDKNGFIDRKELKTLFAEMAEQCNIPKKKVGDYSKKFDECDINKDGKLSYEEFKKLGNELMDKVFTAALEEALKE